MSTGKDNLTRRAVEAGLLTFVLVVWPVGALASDLEITCETDGGGIDCNSSPIGQPLFNEGNMAPGETVVKSLRVNNNHAEDCNFSLNTKNESSGDFNLADKLWTVIRGAADIFGLSDGDKAANNKSMTDLFDEEPVGFGAVEAGSVQDYQWIVTFDKDADNDWQSRDASFDFDMTFECDEVEGAFDGQGGPGDQGPDPSDLPGGAVLGAMGGSGPSGGIVKGLLERFPVTGENGEAVWGQAGFGAGKIATFILVFAIVVLGFVLGGIRAARMMKAGRF